MAEHAEWMHPDQLQELKLSELRKRAVAIGVNSDELEDARDEDEPKVRGPARTQPSRRRWRHLNAALYISLVIMYRQYAGRRHNGFGVYA
jgi:hypothetical protein